MYTSPPLKVIVTYTKSFCSRDLFIFLNLCALIPYALFLTLNRTPFVFWSLGGNNFERMKLAISLSLAINCFYLCLHKEEQGKSSPVSLWSPSPALSMGSFPGTICSGVRGPEKEEARYHDSPSFGKEALFLQWGHGLQKTWCKTQFSSSPRSFYLPTELGKSTLFSSLWLNFNS